MGKNIKKNIYIYIYGNILQYSCLENPMDRESWQATVHGVTKSWVWLCDQTTMATRYNWIPCCILETNTTFREGNGKPLQYSCLEHPMDGGAWWAAVHGVATESVETKRLHFHFSVSHNGEGNGNPLQCSCLENPRDGRAWWAAVYGVAQSRTLLRWLSSSSSSSNTTL